MTNIQVHRLEGRFMVLPNSVNAFVVELPNKVVVVDTTLAISSAKELRAIADGTGKPIEAVLITHGHPDHFTGLVAFPSIPSYAHPDSIAFMHREDNEKHEDGVYLLGDDYPADRLFPNRLIDDGFSITVDGATFTYTNLGPGESDNDGMWVVEDDAGVQHAFVGDHLATGVHAYFADGHTADWIAALRRLQTMLRPDALIYTGHGPSPVGQPVIGEQIAYIEKFLELVKALPEGTSLEAATESVSTAMQAYAPDALLVTLLTYKLDQAIARAQAQLRAPRTPRQTIEAYYRHANAGEWGPWCDLFAEDTVMDEQLAGHIEGAATLRAMMANGLGGYAVFRNEPQRVVVEGLEAAVLSRVSGQTHLGAQISCPVMNYFRFNDAGEIVYLTNTHDTAPFQPLFDPANKPNVEEAAPAAVQEG